MNLRPIAEPASSGNQTLGSLSRLIQASRPRERFEDVLALPGASAPGQPQRHAQLDLFNLDKPDPGCQPRNLSTVRPQ